MLCMRIGSNITPDTSANPFLPFYILLPVVFWISKYPILIVLLRFVMFRVVVICMLILVDNFFVILGQVEEKGLTLEIADKIGTFVKGKGAPFGTLI